MRTYAAAAIAAAAVLALPACGGSGKSGATTATTAPGTTVAGGCAPAPPAVVRRIARGVVLVGAKLERPRIVQSKDLPGYYFISARVREIAPGAVATWSTQGIDPVRQVIAVDENAIEISEFGSGSSHVPPVTLGAAGALESRDCVTHGAR